MTRNSCQPRTASPGSCLSHRQFLELLFQDELNVRAQRSLERRKELTQFPDLQPLENFDWQFNPQINRAQIYQLATAQFVRERRDVLLLARVSQFEGDRTHKVLIWR